MTVVDLGGGALLGRVARVEPGRVLVEVADPSLFARFTVSDLVAVEGQRPEERLIGLVVAVAYPHESREDHRRAPDGVPGTAQVTLLGTLSHGLGDSTDSFKRGADFLPHAGARCRLVEGEQLHGLMSVLGENVPSGQRLALGRFVAEREATAIADGDRLFQRHAAVLGSTGTGKSWAVAHVLDRAARLPHANIVVFDMHGEYRPLTERADDKPAIARSLRIAGPGDLGEPDDVLFVPYWLLDRDELLSLVLDPTDQDAPTQAMRVSDQIHKLKRSALLQEGREETAATITVDSPVPYRMQDLVEWLRSDDVEKVVQQPSGDLVPGPYAGRLTRFVARLQARVADGRYAFMFSPPPDCLEYDWLGRTMEALLSPGIKVIDFSEVPAEALPVVTGVIARLLYDVQFWMDPRERAPLSLVCDEAHLYMSSHAGTDTVHGQALLAFEQIAKEGRKYGVGLVIVSQRPADVSRTVLSQCNNFVVMRLTNDHDQQVVEQLMPESMTALIDILPLLDTGEAVILGDALLLPTRFRFDRPAIAPASATRAFWTEWTERSTPEGAIAIGVEALRRQLRGPGSASPEPADADPREPLTHPMPSA